VKKTRKKSEEDKEEEMEGNPCPTSGEAGESGSDTIYK